MFLSALVSQLEPDGSLVVDLADERGPVLRFGALGGGMPWARLEGQHWVPTDHDYGVLLVNDAHERRPELPVNRYIAGVPREDLEILNRVRYLQATVLALYARWPEARELLAVNPVLLWMTAERYAADPDSRHRVSGWLLKPQKELLGWLLREAARDTQVRFLQRLVLDRGDRDVVTTVRRCVTTPGIVAKLRHWPKVPTGLLTLLLEAPAVTDLKWLRDELAATRNEFDVMRVVAQRRRFLRDTARMITMLNAGQPDDVFQLKQYQSWKSVKALHDRLLRAARQLGWQNLLDSEVSPTQVLPAPPIASDERFQAITTVAELVQEGEQMHHCVVTRAADVMARRCALYRVNVAGERATLEITLGRDGEPLAIDEFRLACNAEPSEASWQAARAWLEEGCKAFLRLRAA